MDHKPMAEAIIHGKTTLGIELGSTRIKGVLITGEGTPLATGYYQWENKLENGLWTYALEEVWRGIAGCYQGLKEEVSRQYGIELKKIGAITISAMMHGYLAFDKNENLLVPFRTWRNTMTGAAAAELTKLFSFNVPQRWSIAHLYQAMLNEESHVPNIAFMTTLAGYVHWQLTGEKVLGIGDASGMFPIDSNALDYDENMLKAFNNQGAAFGLPFKVQNILPKVLVAGDKAGQLTAKGAALLDPTGSLEEGIPFYPPEGDAATGMVSTNSILMGTGNVSAGTSIFAMVVLEKALQKVHEEIDMVTTPDGKPVAMVHCNNCTSDINAWADLFMAFTKAVGMDISPNLLFETLFQKGLEGDVDAGGLLAYNYLSGEHTTGFEEGRPLFVRTPTSRFTLENFMRTHLYTALATLKLGMDILLVEEKVALRSLLGHGGFFKTEKVGQQLLADAMNVPVTVMETADEGGAWGAALLAGYGLWKTEEETLENYLKEKIFAAMKRAELYPQLGGVEGFNGYMKDFVKGLAIERAAVDFTGPGK